MTSLTATDARKGFFELLKKTNDQHEIYHIRHRSGDAVLMSEQEYDSIHESLELLSSPGFPVRRFRSATRVERRASPTGELASGQDALAQHPHALPNTGSTSYNSIRLQRIADAPYSSEGAE